MKMIRRIYYYYSEFGIVAIMIAIKAKLLNQNILIKISRQDINSPFYLRCKTTDLSTYDRVFIDQEYDFATDKSPRVIVDAGANIGLASIYFASRYPSSIIIAIEPEASNYELLKKNVALYANIITLNAALWNKNEEISVVDPGIGKHGFITQEKDNQEEIPRNFLQQVHGITVDKIMEDYELTRIDILKMDIEGAELEVFKDSSSWIGKVNAIIVELHERMKPGCNRSFYNGSSGFDVEWNQGENVYLSREKCITRRST